MIKHQKLNLSFNSDENIITCDEDIKLQGLTLDAWMTFRSSKQVFKCFIKATKQLKADKRVESQLCELLSFIVYHD